MPATFHKIHIGEYTKFLSRFKVEIFDFETTAF
jgi:hypothetical protein